MCDVKCKQGFTLMELLVVLLIIGILSTVALRTIDATRDRSLFDQTTKEMNQLVQAIVGNPDLTYDGRRVDFGYFGDMEQLPSDLRDLVYNPTGTDRWRGPYFKLMSAGDTISYRYDAWGGEYSYVPASGWIISGGNGKYSMTVKVADTLTQLTNNTISGSFLDHDDNPPGVFSTTYMVRLFYNNPDAHGGESVAVVNPSGGGSYEISFTPAGDSHKVPIGTHKMQAIASGETLTRYVTVVPRSHTVVDFKFTKSFWNKLRMVGEARPTPESAGFIINVVNDQPDSVTINWLHFYSTPASAYMRYFLIDGKLGTGFPLGPTDPGIGNGDTVRFAPLTVAPGGTQMVELLLQQFYPVAVPAPPDDTLANVCGKDFVLRFSEGSEIKFTVPYP
jgi:prepilin-type N-terminal cleavage/methylation domain-containing protein